LYSIFSKPITKRYSALTITTYTFLYTSIFMLLTSDIIRKTNQFQYVQEHYNVQLFDIYLGVDGISIYFILLTTIIMPIALLSNWDSIKENVKSYLIIMLLLETLLLVVFMSLDIMLFYIFFESILPPLFILIGIFGSDNKVNASYYLFLYAIVQKYIRFCTITKYFFRYFYFIHVILKKYMMFFFFSLIFAVIWVLFWTTYSIIMSRWLWLPPHSLFFFFTEPYEYFFFFFTKPYEISTTINKCIIVKTVSLQG